MTPPVTPTELQRLRAHPEVDAVLPTLAQRCPIWARIAAQWERLCVELDFECPYGRGHAPNTHRMLEACRA